MGYYSEQALDALESGRPYLPNIPLPYARGSKTSRKAAESMRSYAASQRMQILQFIKSRGVYGATCDETEIALNLSHQTASARFSDLKKISAIRETSQERSTRTGSMASVCIFNGEP